MMKRFLAFAALRWALFLSRRGKKEAAIRCLRRIALFAPSYSYAYLHLGLHLTEDGFEEGLRHMEKAIELSPENSVFYFFQAMALYDRGEFSKAREQSGKGLKFDAENLMGHNCLALCHLAEGEFEKFLKLVEDRGIFENPVVQSRFLLALEAQCRR